MTKSLSLKNNTRSGFESFDYKSELNDEQYAAVTAPNGASLIIAGAGSGKTRTLVYRLAWLVDQGIKPYEILLLTFTNKAAKEMLERASQLIHEDIGFLWGGTFHSFAAKILRKHAQSLNISPSFTIIDSEDQKNILKTIIQNTTDPKNYKTASKNLPKPEIIRSIYSYSQNTNRSIDDIILQDYPLLKNHLKFILKIIDSYTNEKKESHFLDFDDLLIYAVKLLEKIPEVRSFYQHKFKHILVDEYQDTNNLQDRLISVLTGENENLMAVGDDSQSIYSWRGANVEHILNFKNKYPQAKIYHIETNYRSVPEILALSNESISYNQTQYQKKLSAARPSSGIKPGIMVTNTPKEQALAIAQIIEEKHQEENISYSDMAILYRAHYQSLEIQMSLTQMSIPYRITSGIRFFESSHIKDVISFLRIVHNLEDGLAFKRIVKLIQGIGEITAEKIRLQLLKSKNTSTSPLTFSEASQQIKIPKKSQEPWNHLVSTLDEIAEAKSPSEQLKAAYLGFYEDCLTTLYDNIDQRKSDIEQLVTYSESFDSLEDLLEQFALMTNVDSGPDSSKESKDCLTLSSIHQSKGLEWKFVIIPWLSQGAFPNKRVLEESYEKGLEEERRLFYVALTRAKDELLLVYPRFNPGSYTGEAFLKPSQFLTELPKELMEEWEII